MPSGSAVIFRDYALKERRAIAEGYRKICLERQIKFIVGNDVALAEKVDADGLHIPAFSKKRFSNECWPHLLSMSCHNTDELKAAHEVGANFVLLSPAFATESHPGGQSLGPERFTEIAAGSPLPVFALGGITRHNAHLLAGPKTVGFAAIGAFTLENELK